MAQVPYQPFSTAQPISPGEQISVATPGAAFGENIGGAVQGLGQSLERSGGEVFQRAIAIQDLANETEARNADSEYAKEQALLHANFLSNPGPDPRVGLRQFLADSDSLRKKYRDGLSNDAARRMYDSSSLGFMLRNINSAAVHAGEEFKKTAEGASYARIKIARETNPDPANEANAQNIDDITERESHTLASLRNWSEEQRREFVLGEKQKNYGQRLITIGQTDAPTALRMLDPAKVGPDFNAIRQHLWTMNEAAGADKLARDVQAEDPNASIEDKVAQVKERAKELAFDDPKFVPHAEHAIRALVGQIRHDGIVEKATSSGNVWEAIQNSQFTKASEFYANPGFADMARQAHLDPTAIQNLIDRKWKPIGQEFYQHFDQSAANFKGLSYEDREEFFNANFFDPQYHMTTGEINDLVRRRNSMLQKGDPLNSPQVRNISTYMVQNYSDDLKNLGILTKQPNGNPSHGKNWNAFVGHVATAVEAYEAENKKPLTDSEFIKTKLAPALIANQVSTGWFGHSTENPITRGPTPRIVNDVTKQLTQEAQQAGRSPPSKGEVMRAIRQQQWKDFMNKPRDLTGGGAQ